MGVIAPNMLIIIKYKINTDFIEFVRLFSVPVSQTKAEIREILKKYGNNIFQADLGNDIVWALVKLTENGKQWD